MITRALVLLIAAVVSMAGAARPKAVVIVSANAEWREVRKLYPNAAYRKSPYGEWFVDRGTVIFQGGWGKISAAASAQYVVDRWHPSTLINLGTCGGIADRVERFATILVTKTAVYDIVEQMGDAQEAIDFYSTDIDLSWIGGRATPSVLRAPLFSADRDLVVAEIPTLVQRYGTIAVDWESGAIAWVARRNGTRVLILRGVTDLVGEQGGEAYGKIEVFEQGTAKVMKALFESLPAWLALLPR